ncbi:class I SAM-dependent methyltransferase [Atopomonas hussainii]|uniref:class I SAM-dependent methyltransferase n=1 Tax=Atopomonas hussainii TaxID=1429083 RepID=UPI0008FFF2D7|nr:class I SAM-dependent methyltransferase [Atopomonas hussainii]
MTSTTLNPIDANRQAWDYSAALHRQSASWQALCTAIRAADFNCFDVTLLARLNALDVAGKHVVQVGCNNGRECFALYALGAAAVTGIDQSAEFLAQGAELNQLSPHEVRFVACDIHQAPSELHGQFDVLLITIGVLNWMPNLTAFFAAASALLRSGGQIVIYETHPLLEMLDPYSSTPLQLVNSYFQAEPSVDYEAIVYEGAPPASEHPSVWFTHSLAEVFSALLANGLQINHFAEYPHCNREECYEQYEEQAIQLPMCYTLEACK